MIVQKTGAVKRVKSVKGTEAVLYLEKRKRILIFVCGDKRSGYAELKFTYYGEIRKKVSGRRGSNS